jgi:hypothetical protein
MEDFDDFLEIIDFSFPQFHFTSSDRFHELDKFRFYSRFNLTKLTKASVLHFLILIEEEIEFPADT